MLWIVLAATNCTLVVGVILMVRSGTRRIRLLRDIDGRGARHAPQVSVIVAARNEARDITVALESLLALDYGPLEILVVNDRSTDNTGPILDALTQRDQRLVVFHVDQLPPGWLGKNHALFFGAARAQGEFLLFTDADVVMDPSALRRAMAYVQQHDVDHLAVSPSAEMPTALLQAFVVLFFDLFSIYFRPWKAADPRSRAYVGIGAFNLIRRQVYEAVGTHQAIAMRPDDDVKLGKIIKQGGFRQHLLAGTSMVRVPWYASLSELIVGMEKNAFSGVDYSMGTVVAGTAALLLVDVWPFVAVAVLTGPARWIYGATVLLLLTHAWRTARDLEFAGRCALLFPVAVLLLIYIQWRAMLLTYVRRGIRWRDTHYPLDALRANKV